MQAYASHTAAVSFSTEGAYVQNHRILLKSSLCCAIIPESEGDNMPGKREDHISWDEYFMGIAVLSSMRSKDPNTQVGACIVSPDKKIVGVGYNGFPTGCSDDDLPWEREGEWLETKYPYVCHAELNAILNSTIANLKGATLYVALFPCNECAKAIIQSGIKKIIYLSDKYETTDSTMASKKMLKEAGVAFERLSTAREEITISLKAK